MDKLDLTLDEVWSECLKMWESIATEWRIRNGYLNIGSAKLNWMNENGYDPAHVYGNCFFCHYAKKMHRVQINDRNDTKCTFCPGRLVDNTFGCGRAEYRYCDKPVAFYQKLLELDKIRG